MQRIRSLFAGALLLAVTACSGTAGADGSAPRPRARADLITLEEIQRGSYSNVYELVRDLRPRWLQPRGVDTINGTPGQVQAHVDGTRMGAVTNLRNIPVGGVTSIEWVAPTDAAGRFGLDHGHGAILVSTRPM